MNNVIFLVIDSLGFEYLNSDFAKSVSAPFLNKLREDYLSVEQMYSQAPFTEGAVMGLCCGQRTLDHNGYLRRTQDAENNLFKLFHNNGYTVFNNSIQPYCMTKCLFQGIDYPFITEFINVDGIKRYRLNHYAGLYASNSLTKDDYDFLYDLLDDFFESYCDLLRMLIDKSPIVELIAKAIPEEAEFENSLSLAEKEKTRYEGDKRAFIDSLLSHENESIFQFKKFEQTRKTDPQTKAYFIKESKQLRRKIGRQYFRHNICNKSLRAFTNSLKKLMRQFNKKGIREFLISSYSILNSKVDLDLNLRFKDNYDSFKSANSLHTRLNHFLNWHKQYKDEKPYFAYIHVDDIHSPEMFFSYDSDDKDLLLKEICQAEELLKRLPKNHKGNFVYELGMQYVDTKIKAFYQELEKRGSLNDTILIITSDHGYSYYNYPVRENYVKNFYLENYHIPFILVDNERKAVKVEGYYQSYDILTSLCDLLGLSAEKKAIGKSIFSENATRNYITMEYMGGGCPDITRRPLQYAIFDEELFVSAEATLSQPIDESKIKQIFDMKKDPLQLRPISIKSLEKKSLQSKYEQFLNILNLRHNEIRGNYTIDGEN